VPVTVNVAVDGAAFAAAARVSVDVPPAVTLAGEKLPVTPDGSPVTDRAIVCVLPLTAVVDTANVLLDPAGIVRLAGVTAIVKSGGVIVSDTGTLCWVLADVAVTVSVYDPGVAVPPVTDNTEPPPVVMEAGLNDAVAPAGTPVTESASDSATPDTTDVEIVVLPGVLAPAEKLDGFALMAKSFAGSLHPGNANVATRVRQFNVPSAGRCSPANQNVQSSIGSTVSEL
jgi:hypothetical protein